MLKDGLHPALRLAPECGRRLPLGRQARCPLDRRRTAPDDAVQIAVLEPWHAAEAKRLGTRAHEELGFAYDPRLDGRANLYGDRGGFRVVLDSGKVALGEVVGLVAESKRVYLLPRYRGQGVGLTLLRYAMGVARRRGFGEVRLDPTLRQPGAIRPCEGYGFERISRDGEPPYCRLTP